MSLSVAEKLTLPIEPYEIGGYRFGEKLHRRFGVPAIHLGDDIIAAPGTPVRAVGEGTVVLARTLAGSEQQRNWGGVVVIEHQTQNSKLKTQKFYSVYGHLRDLRVKVGEAVRGGHGVGSVASALTPENGWWKNAHLHFGIYTGSWKGEILPGWWRPEQFWITRLSRWQAPKTFIDNYNKL